jgi:hypothetical protein
LSDIWLSFARVASLILVAVATRSASDHRGAVTPIAPQAKYGARMKSKSGTIGSTVVARQSRIGSSVP